MKRALIALALLAVGSTLLPGCPPPSSRSGETPAGTPTDPVQVCTQVGDVCRIDDDAPLGVCNKSTARCPGPDPCLACVPQH